MKQALTVRVEIKRLINELMLRCMIKEEHVAEDGVDVNQFSVMHASLDRIIKLTRTVVNLDVFSLTSSRTAALTASGLGKIMLVEERISPAGPELPGKLKLKLLLCPIL